MSLFAAPHRCASSVSIIGGDLFPAQGDQPCCAWCFVLDEMPEFHRDVLEALRQSMEDHVGDYFTC